MYAKVLQVILTATLADGCAAASGALDGAWRSQGWGFVYQVQGADWQAYEVTSKTCVAGFKAKRVASGRPGNGVTFQIRHGNLFSIVDGAGSEHKRITAPRGLTSIAIERIGSLPKPCTPPTANTLLNNFEVFTATSVGSPRRVEESWRRLRIADISMVQWSISAAVSGSMAKLGMASDTSGSLGLATTAMVNTTPMSGRSIAPLTGSLGTDRFVL
ncbi:MAG: hypothetical protein IT161_20910 [Bryobacterales bacterium]|nr:hypothetical protein [Bryobacterales bacterium]